jgi:hypothetical protein
MSWATQRVEYAPGFSPYNLPGSLDWDTLGSCRSVDFSRGRQWTTDKMEPGTGTFVIDDEGGTIFAAVVAGTIPPTTPVRVVVNYSSVDYVVFTGFMVDAPQPAGWEDARTVTVSAVDWLGWANGVTLPPSTWAMEVARRDPALWWTDQATGSVPMRADLNDRVINRGSAGAAGDLYAAADPYGGYPMFLDSGVPNHVVGETGSSWSNGWATTKTSLSFGTTYQFAFWFSSLSAPASDQVMWAITENPPTGDLGGLRLRVALTTAGYVQALVTTGSGTSTATAAANHCDGADHLVMINVNTTIVTVDTDLADDTAALAAVALTGGYVWTNSSNNVAFNWSSAAFSDGVGASPTADGYVDNTIELGNTQPAVNRVQSYLNMVGVEYPTFENHSSGDIASSGITAFSETVADAIIALFTGRVGAVWMTREGSLRMRDHLALTDADYAAHYQTEIANLTDRPEFVSTKWGARKWGAFKWGPSEIPVVQREVSGTTAGRFDRIINEVMIVDPDGLSFGEIDAASQAAYGRRVLTIDSDVPITGATLLREAPRDLVASFAEPPVEVGQVTVRPWRQTTITEFVLAVELENAVHYHESYADQSLMVHGKFRVQSETWSWANGTEWTVTYTLTAA